MLGTTLTAIGDSGTAAGPSAVAGLQIRYMISMGASIGAPSAGCLPILCFWMIWIRQAIGLDLGPHGSSAPEVEHGSTSRTDSSISARQHPRCRNNQTPPTQESMSNPNPASPRPTLKLKIGARMSPRETRTAPVTQSNNPNKSKPGAHWSDEYKQRMQRDMDRLLR
jgi:hypothetical protein